MKVGIVSVAHHSKVLRPNGLDLIKKFVKSLKCIKYDYTCIVVDNASETPLKIENVNVIRIDNQDIYGLTGAWEVGLRKAINMNFDIIIINNDDIEYNDSVNNFIDDIIKHPYNQISVYGPLSNGIKSGVQLQKSVTNEVIELTNNTGNMINGFMFGFTKNFYYTFAKTDGCMFNKERYPWGGNEEEFQRRIWKSGGRSFVLGSCWVNHIKLKGWQQFKQ